MKNRLSRITRATFLLLMRFQYLRLVESHILIARDVKQYVDYGRKLICHGTFSKDDTIAARLF
jgi:hypothetical protein